MATSNNRDVKLAVEIQATGEENLQRLAAEVRNLAKAGGDAAPQYVELANELDRVAAQARELTAFKTAAAGIDEATAASKRATVEAERLGLAFKTQQAATEGVRASQALLQEAYNQTRRDIADQILQKTLLSQKYKDGEIDESKYRDELSKTKIELANLNKSLAGYRVSLTEAKTATAGANTELAALAKSSLAASANSESLGAALRVQNTAMEQARAAGEKLGADFNNVAAAQERLESTLRGGVAALESNAKAARLKADADQASAVAAREETAAVAAQSRAQQALDGIRRAAAALNRAAEIKAEAEEQRQLTAVKAQAERGELALFNIRKLAAAQNRAAEIKAEAAATLELAAAAERAGRALPDAFGAVGVRSIQAIQAEINQTTRALRLLEVQQEAGTISTLDLARATGAAQLKLQQLRSELTLMPAAVGVFERMNSQVMDLVTRFGALSVAITTVGFAVKPVYDATVQLESMRRVLTQVFGSAEEAASAIEFVSKVANDAGVSIKSVAGDFTKFAASAKTAGIETETIKEVFASVAGAVGNLGLGSEQASRILTALAQSASKGKIQMEELGQQLGDALPGALGLLAKGLDITQPQLVKLIESGRLLTDQALKPLAQAMLELSAPNGRVESTAASFARLGNAITETYRSIGDSAAFKLLGQAAGALAENFDKAITAVKLLGEALLVNKILTAVTNFVTLRAAVTATTVATAEATVATTVNTAATTANTTAKVANAAATLGAAGAMAATVPAAKAAADGLVGLNFGLKAAAPAATVAANSAGLASRAFGAMGLAARGAIGLVGGIPGALILLALNFKDLADAAGKGAAALVGFGDKSKEVNKGLDEAEKAIKRNAEAREAEGDSVVKLNVLYAEQAAVLAKATATNEKLADATKARGEASVLAAGLSGNEAEKIAATTVALEQETEALSRVAAGKAAEANLTAELIAQTEKSIEGKGRLGEVDQARLDTLNATEALLGNLTRAEKEELGALFLKEKALVGATAATKAQIEADKLKLAGQQASADAAQALAEKERALADASALAAEAAKNNAGRVQELNLAYLAALESVDLMKGALDRGEVSQEAYTRSVIAAGKAQGLYKDALKDAADVGVDIVQIQTGVSDAYIKTTDALRGTITSLKDLGLEAEKTSPQVSDALNKQIEAAKTREELDLVRQEVLRARDAFVLMGGDAAAALDKIAKKTADLSPALQQAQRDAALLGITLKDKIGQGAGQGVESALGAYERLKAGGKASSDEINKAFENLANQAIKAAGGIVPEWVRVEAGIRGATISVDKFGNATVTAGKNGAAAVSNIVGIFDEARAAADRAADAALRYGSALKSTQYDKDKFALGSDGQRFTAGGQLKPPDASGDWEFVGDVRASNLNVPPGAVAVMGQGYWKKTKAAQDSFVAGGNNGTPAGPSNNGRNGTSLFGSQAARQDSINATGKTPPQIQAEIANRNAGTTGLSAVQANQVAAGSARTININLNGRTTPVNVTSEADANRLEALLDRLMVESLRSGP